MKEPFRCCHWDQAGEFQQIWCSAQRDYWEIALEGNRWKTRYLATIPFASFYLLPLRDRERERGRQRLERWTQRLTEGWVLGMVVALVTATVSPMVGSLWRLPGLQLLRHPSWVWLPCGGSLRLLLPCWAMHSLLIFRTRYRCTTQELWSHCQEEGS